jgi:transcriptional antiterminator RfaH
VHSTLGVRRIVGNGGQPSVLDKDFIRCLRLREVDGVITRPDQPLHAGQQVRIIKGAFEGLVATIIAVDERDRLTLLMDLLKQSVKVTTDVSGVWAL